MKKIMELLQNMKAKKEQKDNRGFSLVELIIVIAIMAILVGIVGTQVLPYIDKSRHAKDVQVLSGLCTDATAAYSSTASELTDSEYTITIGTSVTVTAKTGSDTAGATKLQNAFAEYNGVTKVKDLKLESKEGKKVTAVTITCKDSKPMVSVTTTGGTFDTIESK